MNSPYENKKYIVVVQCHIVKERCSGFLCEKAFDKRTGGFSSLPKEQSIRTLYMTCGGCYGLAVHRKLTNFIKLAKKDGIDKDQIAVHLSSCITKDNFHGPPCPFINQIRELISRHGLDIYNDTHISEKSEERRQHGIYSSG
jgi:predicted metal-binding protein